MKKILIISIALLQAGNHINAIKKPIFVESVQGYNLPTPKPPKKGDWAVVYTTITTNPMETERKLTIQRNTVGIIRSGSTKITGINRELKVPELLPEKAIMGNVINITNAVADIAAAANPKAGAIAVPASIAIQESLRIAGDELSNQYGYDQKTIQLIELIPTDYYEIAGSEIQLKDAFYKDYAAFNQKFKKFISLDKKNANLIKDYINKKNAIAGRKPGEVKPGTKPEQIEEVLELGEKVEKILPERQNLISDLAQFDFHRIVLMAAPSPATKQAGCEGHGEGPWSLVLKFYVGAKMINSHDIHYCNEKSDSQKLIVKLVPSYADKEGIFHSGGIQLIKAPSDNISFARTEEGTGRVDWGSSESEFFSWADEAVVDTEGLKLDSLLFPFDLFKLRENARTEQEKLAIDALKTRLESAVAAITALKNLPKGADAEVDKKLSSKEDSEKEAETKLLEGVKEKGKEEVEETGKEEALAGKNKSTKTEQRSTKSAPAIDYYKVLGLPSTATAADIKKARNNLALEWHPDKTKHPKDEAAAMMAKINEAFEVLSNPERRKEYDRILLAK